MEKMTKLKEYLLEVAFICLMGRMLFIGASIAEALALFSLICSMTYNKWITKSNIDEKEVINKKIDDLATRVQALSMDRALRRTVNESQNQGPNKRIF